jgi:hypothetical protein
MKLIQTIIIWLAVVAMPVCQCTCEIAQGAQAGRTSFIIVLTFGLAVLLQKSLGDIFVNEVSTTGIPTFCGGAEYVELFNSVAIT